MTNADEILKEFLIESYENLDRLDRELLQLEQCRSSGTTDGSAHQNLSSIFRTIHTIKGTSGFFGFSKLQGVTHVGENMLSKMRDGLLPVTPENISGLLALVDAVRGILARVEASGSEGDQTFEPLIELLTRLKEGQSATVAATPATAEAVTPPMPVACLASVVSAAPAEAAECVQDCSPVAQAQTKPATAAIEIDPPAATVVTGAATSPSHPQEPTAEPASSEHVETSAKSGPVADTTIRVDVALLDKLMTLVGELVLARNQVLQFTADAENPNLLATSQRLNLITTELQEGVMKTRMQPIGNVWSKFPRIVRDLAIMCGKKIRVEMEGEGTELDKTIIEAIKDPLTHIVRNSADHGIESPGDRSKHNKPEEGRLFLRAFHEGGQVNIEISDDGGGIAVEKVKAKALKQNLITADQATRMSDREAVNLIFLPGFSTAEKITNVSGRGVGMDVVKTNIERIGGTVDVQTVLSRGTTIRIKIPLTLAIIPALIVSAGGDQYAIPQVSLVELVRLEGGSSDRVEQVHGAEVYRLRGKLLPVVRLGEALELPEARKASASESLTIVVLSADDRLFGLVVDEVNDTEEIVVKPLSKQLKRISAYAGSTIMGDGRVALILDAMGLAQSAHVTGEARHNSSSSKSDTDHTTITSQNCQTLLLLDVCGNRRAALPLSAVARLEEFAWSTVERAGNMDVVQYRGEVVPLVYLSAALGGGETKNLSIGAVNRSGEKLQAVVYTHDSRRVVLVVDRILDIVEETITLQPTGAGAGILGTAPIQGKVTELLDLPSIVRGALSTLAPTPRAKAA